MFLSRVISTTAKFPVASVFRPLATASVKPAKVPKEPKAAKVKVVKEPRVVKERKEKPPKKDPSLINKGDLVDHLSITVQVPRKKVDEILTEFVKFVEEQTRDNGKSVRLSGFGVFKHKASPARTRRNPKTQEAVAVPASKSFSFITSKTVKV